MVVGDWEATAEIPFRKVVKRNLRTWPIANRLLPWNWFKNSTGVETLAAQYERNVTRLRLSELPDRPRFLINATDLPFAVNWVFDSHLAGAVRGRMGDYQVGYLRPLPNWPLARAVAASSCFPPIFNPMPLKLRPNEMLGGKYAKGNRDKIVGSIGVSDGGIYDNLGLEPVWKDHAILLVSDGGGSFEPDAARGLFWRLQRYVSVVDSQVRALRKRWLISNFISGQIRGAYWGIGGVANHYYPDARGYSEELVDDTISEVALI
jgi:NTE family protein